jgi:hypothetical protein
MDIYSWLSYTAQLRLFVGVFLLGLVVMYAIARLSSDLKTTEAPMRGISLQLAGPEKAEAIVDSWKGTKREDALLNIGVDYLFLFLYPLTISLACSLLAKSELPPWLSTVGLYISIISLFAIVFDAVENFAMLKMLREKAFEPWANVSRAFSVSKLAVISLGLVYIISALVAKVLPKN